MEYLHGATVIYADWSGYQAQGQRRWYADSLTSGGYDYDAAGRLVSASQQIGTGGCTTRGYAYDANGDLAGLTTYGPAPDGGCQSSSVAAARTWTFDQADRNADPGYTFDDAGRTLTVPAADTTAGGGDMTLAYYTNDLVRSVTQNGVSSTNTLDVQVDRFGATTTGTVTRTHHYRDDSDSPSWTAEDGWYTRYIRSFTDVAAVYTGVAGHLEWQITNLRGDVVATTTDVTGGLETPTSTTSTATR